MKFLREKLCGVGHRLELERIAGGVEQEHRRLLAGLTCEANRGGDHELGSRALQPLGERAPFVHRQDQPEMRHRHRVAVDRVDRAALDRIRSKVGNDLVAVKVEIDPMIGASAFRAPEQVAVESPRGR